MTSFHAVSLPVNAKSSFMDSPVDAGMQELTLEEMDQVHGGFGPAGAIAGAVGAGLGVALTGGNAAQVVAGAIFGGVSGFFGGLGMYASSAAVAAMGAVATGKPDTIRFAKNQR